MRTYYTWNTVCELTITQMATMWHSDVTSNKFNVYQTSLSI